MQFGQVENPATSTREYHYHEGVSAVNFIHCIEVQFRLPTIGTFDGVQESAAMQYHDSVIALDALMHQSALGTQHPVTGFWFISPQTTVGKFSPLLTESNPQAWPFQRCSDSASLL